MSENDKLREAFDALENGRINECHNILREALAASKPEPSEREKVRYAAVQNEATFTSNPTTLDMSDEAVIARCMPEQAKIFVKRVGDGFVRQPDGSYAKPEPQAQAAEPESTWCWKERIQNARELHKVFSPDAVEQIVKEAIAQRDAALDACVEALEECKGALVYAAFNYDGSKPEDLPANLVESTGVSDTALIAALTADAAITKAQECRKQ